MLILERYTKETGREYALRVIKHNVIHSILEPGTILSSNRLAEALFLSRTPVNEALQELSLTGIIEILPQVGNRVSLIDTHLVQESRFLRMIVEPAIGEILCESIDDQQLKELAHSLDLQEMYLEKGEIESLLDEDKTFHRMMFAFADKQRSYNAVNSLDIHFERVRFLGFPFLDADPIVQAHRKIFQALSKRDSKLAKELVREHLSSLPLCEQLVEEHFPSYLKK